MKMSRKVLCVLVISFFINHVEAQYEMQKYAISSGSADLSAGQYELSGIIGQADASIPIANGSYVIRSGYLQQNNDLIFKNKFD